jgi:plastocyanin
VADPEQIYQEVLQEEQGKGSAGPVAEGRAKAARARAEAGSPHPKEVKWWPGAQPQFEGGGAAPAPAAEEPAEQPEAASEPPPEEPAEEAPAPTADAEVQAEPAPEPSPPPAVEAPPPAAPTPTEQQAPAAAVAATATELAPEDRPAGVRHGTTSGTRLRPEDEVTTEAQFEGEAAVARRRKLIDELVGTGVPSVSAQEAGGPRSPWLVLMYLVIPLVAIALLASQEGEPAAEPTNGAPANGGGGLTISASNVQFDTDALTFPAGEEATLTFVNDDAVQHNVSIYPDESGGDALFEGQIIEGGAEVEYEVPALDAGEYYFQCDVHPGMNGTVTAE